MWTTHDTHSQLCAILLIAVIIPKVLTIESYNNQHQRYDYIDVAKETTRGRSKGQTTRIFTTNDELDEKFWLRYLGINFRDAVHFQVDDNSNVIPMEDTKPQHQSITPFKDVEEKHARFVRQPPKNDVDKQLPVENIYKPNQYPTEKPETFFATNFTTSLPPPDHATYEHSNAQPTATNNKHLKISKHKDKLFMHNKYKPKITTAKAARPLKAIHEPIVVNLPEMDNSEHQINEKPIPVVVNIPPVIYHQRSELYSEKNSNNYHMDGISSIPLNDQNIEFYDEQIPPNAPLSHHAQHSHKPHLRLPLKVQQQRQHRYQHHPQTEYATRNQVD